MSKITFLIASLNGGGAEHQLCELINNLEKLKRFEKIELITFADTNDHYQISPYIERRKIATGAGKTVKYISLVKTLLFSNSSCIVAFGLRESRLALIPLIFKRTRFIVGDRNLSKNGWYGLNRLLYKVLFNRADAIVPNSFSEKRQIEQYFPKVAKKINVITNFTDLHKYTPTYNNSNSILRICIFARFNPQKNVERFVNAIRILKSLTDVPFIIDWYGSTTIRGENKNPYYIQIKNLIVEYGLSDIFFLKEAIKDVASKMGEYDAFCLPSIFEGFSNSISEAICCGLPCIVSDVSDNSIMVHDGENGFLFNPLDETDIAKTMLKFINTSVMNRRSMGIKSRTIAETLFDRNKFTDAYIKLFINET